VRHRDRPGAEAESLGARGAAEIEIVEVEGEAWIEADAALDERLAPRREEDAVEQLAWSDDRAIEADLAQRGIAMRDGAAQMRQVERLGAGAMQPRALPRLTARIAGDAEKVECLQAFEYPVGELEILEPDVVVHEDEDLGGRARDAAIVHFGQAAGVFERDLRGEPRVLRDATQGHAQRRVGKSRGIEPGGADNLDHDRASRTNEVFPDDRSDSRNLANLLTDVIRRANN